METQLAEYRAVRDALTTGEWIALAMALMARRDEIRDALKESPHSKYWNGQRDDLASLMGKLNIEYPH